MDALLNAGHIIQCSIARLMCSLRLHRLSKMLGRIHLNERPAAPPHPPRLTPRPHFDGRQLHSSLLLNIMYLILMLASVHAQGGWIEVKPSGAVPAARGYHSSAPVNNKLLVFGGYYDGEQHKDLWEYAPLSVSWIELTPLGVLPAARCCHSSLVVNNKMLVFGGWGGELLNDLWEYVPLIGGWIEVKPSGALPAARGHHSSAPYDAIVYNEVWEYAPLTGSWIEVTPLGVLPAARYSHSSAAVNNKMLVFGGWGGGMCFNDLWEYTPHTGSWIELTPLGVLPAARYSHTSAVVNNKMLVFGGWDDDVYFNDLWEYTPHTANTASGSSSNTPTDTKTAPATPSLSPTSSNTGPITFTLATSESSTLSPSGTATTTNSVSASLTTSFTASYPLNVALQAFTLWMGLTVLLIASILLLTFFVCAKFYRFYQRHSPTVPDSVPSNPPVHLPISQPALPGPVNRSRYQLSFGATTLSSSSHLFHANRCPFSNDVYECTDTVLGSGGFGMVFLGKVRATGGPVALKVAHLKHAEESLQVKTFHLANEAQREQRVLCKLRHPHIVCLLDSYCNEGVYVLVQEFCCNGSLHTALDSLGTPPMATFCRYSQGILLGAEYLHSLDILHRDIKPHNILLTEGNVCKLADFGSAFRGTDQQVLSGTPLYMAPELVCDPTATKSSDVWSCGVTLWQMATGYHPFLSCASKSPHHTLTLISSALPLAVPEGLTPQLTTLIPPTLAADPLQRPSCTELLAHPLLTPTQTRTFTVSNFQ
eukprot:NODE_362_length_2355_cov_52.166068_g224_i2.p1 GENE.NODE_362_length_2355_cov_52.166068_g224_i2~~NODE_362_length_2355_cov_52.166068_g224_i2.p1  ORF type:complete len:764 (-),score=155.82 NODE_362_length_2355_cov_52.166068_g224_i2:62-2353(-)